MGQQPENDANSSVLRGDAEPGWGFRCSIFPRAARCASARIGRQRLVNVSGCDGRVTGPDRDLMQVGHDIARGVDPRHRRLLMRIDLEASDIIALRAEAGCQDRPRLTAERRIKNVNRNVAVVARDDDAPLFDAQSGTSADQLDP